MKKLINSAKKSIQSIKSGFSRFYISGLAFIKRYYFEKSIESKKLMKAEKITVWSIYREFKKKLVLAKGEKMGRERFKVLLESARETRNAILGGFVTGFIRFYEEKTKSYTTRAFKCIKTIGDFASISNGCFRFNDLQGGFRCCRLENIERVLVVSK